MQYEILNSMGVPLYSCRTYPACKALYRHTSPVQLYHIFPRYHTNDTISEKNAPNMKYVFLFSTQLVSETFIIPRRTERNTAPNVNSSVSTVPVIVVRF